MAPKKRTVEEENIIAYTSKGGWEGIPCSYGYGTDKSRDKYYKFLHVPYAQVPIGDLRFADPVDIKTFDHAAKVSQLDASQQYEDVLYVHIYTPEVRPKKSKKRYTRPVIVFLPTYMDTKFQDDEYGGEFLCAEDVVLVTLFFRQCILGFTGFPEPNEELGVSGAAGFKDIIKGFEFVKNEIRHFGGCPDNITAYGHGLSCAYVRCLALRPFSGKYFHKMILSSSLEHSMEDVLQLRQYDVRVLAKTIHPDGRFKDDRARLEYLRKLPMSTLWQCAVPTYSRINVIVGRKNNLLAVRKDVYGVQMPVLIGFNSMEAGIQWSIIKNPPPTKHEYCLQSLLELSQAMTKTKVVKISRKVIEVYQENLKTIGCSQDILAQMIETDIKFLVGIINLATHLAKEMHPENVYLYQFSADLTKESEKNSLDDKYYPGVAHGFELKTIFNHVLDRNTKKNREESAVVKQIVGTVAQFAKTGNPNRRGLVDIWRPIGEQLTHYYEFRIDCSGYRKFTAFEKIRLQLWEKIYSIDFFSAQIRKLELKMDADKENDEEATVPGKSSVIQAYTILPKEKRRGKVMAYTSKGSIQGEVYVYNSYVYNSFQRVPYAQVPLGNLRFAAPRDIGSFGDFNSLKLDANGRYGPEDDLFLHIYTPEVRRQKSDEDFTRPVIVFVPGRLSAKAEQYRSEDLYGPQFLMQEDVVLVVLSYRRGILGFTAFEEPNAELDVPIDAGVQDIMQGFRFVKNEIQNFGGCPDNVTAYGQGTGATWVRRIAAKHAKDDLFHKMILSSSMEHVTGIELPVNCYAVRSLLRAELQDFTEDKDCIDFLRKMPIEKLLLSDAPLFEQSTNCRVFNKKHLLPLSTQSYETTMPVLIGYNSMEGLMEKMIASSEGYVDVNYSDWQKALEQLSNDRAANKTDFANAVENFYIDKTDITKSFMDVMVSDCCYTIGTVALASHFARAMAPENVYLYKFRVDLACNLSKKLYGCKTFNEAAHADELGYIFKTPVTKCVEPDSYEDLTVKRMTKLWVRFAGTGDPNPENRIGELLDVVWRPVGKKLTKCFHIDTRHVTYGKIPEIEMSRFRYWETMIKLNFCSEPLRKAADFEDKFVDTMTKKDRNTIRHKKKGG